MCRLAELAPTGDPEVDARNKKLYASLMANLLSETTLTLNRLEAELGRLNRNKERRFAREKQKGGRGDSEDGTPNPKSAGTQRKCANCGQVGHIKTNKKYFSVLSSFFCCPS